MIVERKKLYIFDRILMVAQRWQDEADRILTDRMGVTLRQWMLILAILEEFPDHLPGVSEAAVKFGTSRQNIKRLALELQKRDFLIVVNDPRDHRILRLALTGKHKKYMEGSENINWQMEFLNHFFKEMNENELQGLTLGIEKIIEAMPALNNM